MQSTAAATTADLQEKLQAPTAFWYLPPRHIHIDRHYRGTNAWDVPTLQSCTVEPAMCLLGTFFPHCCIMMQRKKLLQDDLSNYTCCAGTCSPTWTQRLQPYVEGKEGAALCLEAFCCPFTALYANRWMVRSHYGLQSDAVDGCLLVVGRIFDILARITHKHFLRTLGDCAMYPFTGCLLAQHEYQMKTHPYPVEGAVPIMK